MVVLSIGTSYHSGMKLADYKLFLDDERMPASAMQDAVIVRDFWEFKRTLIDRGIPRFISFDHYLGDPRYTGKTCAEFFGCLILNDCPEDIADFEYYVHSQNPVGAENIRFFMDDILAEVQR